MIHELHTRLGSTASRTPTNACITSRLVHLATWSGETGKCVPLQRLGPSNKCSTAFPCPLVRKAERENQGTWLVPYPSQKQSFVFLSFPNRIDTGARYKRPTVVFAFQARKTGTQTDQRIMDCIVTREWPCESGCDER